MGKRDNHRVWPDIMIQQIDTASLVRYDGQTKNPDIVRIFSSGRRGNRTPEAEVIIPAAGHPLSALHVSTIGNGNKAEKDSQICKEPPEGSSETRSGKASALELSQKYYTHL